ncbi:MAG TPA: STAS domain-containing protein [Xylella sp.]
MASKASLHRDGKALVLKGPLNRDAVLELWPLIETQRHGICQLDLTGLSRLDSTGLALLAELMEQIHIQENLPRIVGHPPGFDELLAAYRMSSDLQFQS